MAEIEIKLQVPDTGRAAVSRALHRGQVSRARLRARYYDTPDHRLAAAGLALRLRREGRRWVQALKGTGDGLLERLEHEVPVTSSREAPALDIARHDGTPEGRRLRKALGDQADALALRFETDVRRTWREVRLGGTRIELAFDEGELRARDEALPVCEIEFELLQGSLEVMTAVAGRWAARHGLWLDTRSKAERGHWLADGRGAAPVAKAPVPSLHPAASLELALRACVLSAVSQIAPNASWLAAGHTQPEHVHQTRVGLRRLASVLREFGDWSGELDARWIETAREILGRLSGARDRDALSAWLWPALREAGAPPLALAQAGPADDPGAIFRAAPTTQWLLELLSFAHSTPPAAQARNLRTLSGPHLARLHRQLHRAGRTFEALEDEARHRARKRLKRLRYAAEALSSLWPAKAWAAYAGRLRDAQDALGRLQDITVAEGLLRDAAARDPGAAFGLGWIAAQRGQIVAEAGTALAAIGKTPKFLR